MKILENIVKPTSLSLLFRKSELIHDLEVETEKMRRRKTFLERRRINNTFSSNPKAIYRGFRKTAETDINNPPKKEEIDNFGEVFGIKKKIT